MRSLLIAVALCLSITQAYKHVGMFINLTKIECQFMKLNETLEFHRSTIANGVEKPEEPLGQDFNRTYDWMDFISGSDIQVLSYMSSLVSLHRRRFSVIWNRYADYTRKSLMDLVEDGQTLPNSSNIKIITKPDQFGNIVDNLIEDIQKMFNDADDFSKLGRDFLEVFLNLVIGVFQPVSNTTVIPEETKIAYKYLYVLSIMAETNGQLDLLDTVTEALISGFFKDNYLTSATISPEELMEIIDEKNQLMLPSDHYTEPITNLYEKEMVPLVRTYHEKEKVIALHILLPEDEDQTHWMQAMAFVHYCLKSDLNEILQYCWPLLLIVGPKVLGWILSCIQRRRENYMEPMDVLENLNHADPTAPRLYPRVR